MQTRSYQCIEWMLIAILAIVCAALAFAAGWIVALS
jgi:hypothetical protein